VAGACERSPNAAERALDQSDERVLNLEPTRRNDFRPVAFRYTKAMIDVIAMRLNLNVNGSSRRASSR